MVFNTFLSSYKTSKLILFEKKFTIFKDKYNAKPPKGEGFYAHYDGIFYFKNNNL